MKETEYVHRRWRLGALEQSILSFNTLCGMKAALSATTQQDNEVTCSDCRRIIDAVGVNFANQADDHSR
jgi:hypothetical protein